MHCCIHAGAWTADGSGGVPLYKPWTRCPLLQLLLTTSLVSRQGLLEILSTIVCATIVADYLLSCISPAVLKFASSLATRYITCAMGRLKPNSCRETGQAAVRQVSTACYSFHTDYHISDACSSLWRPILQVRCKSNCQACCRTKKGVAAPCKPHSLLAWVVAYYLARAVIGNCEACCNRKQVCCTMHPTQPASFYLQPSIGHTWLVTLDRWMGLRSAVRAP